MMSQLEGCVNPLELFETWLKEAKNHPHIKEPTAMCLATVGEVSPSARMVLLKAHNEQGFVFYTNLDSQKSQEIKSTHRAALCFYWMPLDYQVRIVGRVQAVEEAEADAYFATREREKQLGAWASKQSRAMESRESLAHGIAEMAAKFGDAPIPRPPYWSGWRVVPESIELWHQQDFRWHDRCIFYPSSGGTWTKQWLYP
jgi:pyridoxamine 5'-phosphate oxidase